MTTLLFFIKKHFILTALVLTLILGGAKRPKYSWSDGTEYITHSAVPQVPLKGDTHYIILIIVIF